MLQRSEWWAFEHACKAHKGKWEMVSKSPYAVEPLFNRNLLGLHSLRVHLGKVSYYKMLKMQCLYVQCMYVTGLAIHFFKLSSYGSLNVVFVCGQDYD